MRVVVLASLLVLALTATAAAVTSAADPSRLVLAKSDFPAGARHDAISMEGNYTKALAAQGIKAKATGYSVLLDGKTNDETVNGSVTTTGSSSQAKKLFNLIKADPDYGPKPGSIVRLPAYGDDQWATYDKKNSKAGMYVRKGSVVWQLEVDLNLKTKAQTLAALQGYAAKQKRRVGSG